MNHLINENLNPKVSDLKNKKLTDTITVFLKNFLSDNTRLAYTTDFFDFAAHLHNQNILVDGPSGIKQSHIILYRDYLRSVFAPNTVHRKLSSLSSLFGELQNTGLIESNPVKGTERPSPKGEGLKSGTESPNFSAKAVVITAEAD